MKKKASPWKSIQVGLAVLLVMFVYAYGFEVTQVDLRELRSERRQESLTRVIRALARPEIFEYDRAEVVVNAPVYVPCPPGGAPQISESQTDASAAFVVVTPACGEPGDTLQVEGFNFAPNSTGPLRFVPGSDPSNTVSLGREVAETDENGHFMASFELPNRLSEDVQYIRVTLRTNVGAPRVSRTAHETWDKIIETVFLALLATTIGTLLAIPLSFIAARNLMKSVRGPLASLALSVLGWVIGFGLGLSLMRWVSELSLQNSTSLSLNVAGVLISPLVIWAALRWAVPQVEITPPGAGLRAARLAVVLMAVLIGFYGLYQFASLAGVLGTQLAARLGPLSFLGAFLFQLSDITLTITPVLGALAIGSALGSVLGRLGQRAAEKLPAATVKVLNMLLAALAGATIMILLGALIEWLYEIGRPLYTLWMPGALGALLGLSLALFTKAKDTLPVGIVVYYVTRTILNALRSVEALIMAIVFVIAVGIGPFAGMLALGLHTIVSLAKLYSEQVESILPGPLEAVQATGADRLQTIIYAVVPQIIPPYISYTMYRWDINVRMSTIIGFVGGGGIGFLLQQNINLLNYRAASTQMLAIAIVVASMDYISSVLREKYV